MFIVVDFCVSEYVFVNLYLVINICAFYLNREVIVDHVGSENIPQ